MSKTILITGASRGIGYDLSLCFLEQGTKVIGTSRNGFLPNISNRNLTAFRLDLSNIEDIKDLTNLLKKESLKIDILVNNAGIGPDLGTVKPDLKTFKDTLDVNVIGTTFLTESLISFINEGGKIINISSKMGSINSCQLTDSVAYRMSKSALNMYTKILTNRVQGSLNVASVHPGWVRTNISENSAKNGRLSPVESAKKIFDFIMSDFRNGIFWDVEAQNEVDW